MDQEWTEFGMTYLVHSTGCVKLPKQCSSYSTQCCIFKVIMFAASIIRICYYKWKRRLCIHGRH